MSRTNSRIWIVIVIGVLGLVATAWLYAALRNRAAGLRKAEFDGLAHERVDLVQSEFGVTVEEVVFSVGQLYVASEHVERSEFRTFVLPYLDRHERHLLGVAWLPRVGGAARAQHEAEVRAEGFDEYALLDFATEEVLPFDEDALHFPVAYIEQMDRNADMLGVDFATEPKRARAIRQALESGQPASTPPVPLLGSEGGTGLVIAMPGKARDADADDPAIGALIVAIRISDFVDHALKKRAGAHMALRVLIETDEPGEFVLACAMTDDGTPLPEPSNDPTAFSYEGDVKLAGRNWRIECYPLPAFGTARADPGPTLTLVIGLLLVAALTAYMYLLTERTARTEALVRERTAKLSDRAAELRRANDRLDRQSKVIDATPDFVGVATVEGRVLLVNRGGRDLVGLAPDADVRSMHVSDFHPAWSQRVLEATAFPVAEEEGAWTGELALLHRDGQEIPVSTVILAHHDAEGRIARYSAIMRDTRDRKRLELERARYFSASMDLMCIADTSGYFRRANPAWERVLGYTEEELCSRPFIDFVHPDDRARTLEELAKLSVGVDTVYFENRYRAKDGSYRWLAWNCPAADPGSTTLYATARDMTAARRTQEALREAKEAAESASRAKSQFLANMSHELRTPLNAIMGYSYLLEQEAHERGQESFVDDLKRIHSAGQHLLTLINDVLDLSKIEAGRMELHLETFAIAPLVEEVLTTVKPLMSEKGNDLEARVPSDIGTMHSDPTRTRQILLNLLSNAAKFTSGGRITARISRSVGHNGDLIRFAITDTGIGMTPAQTERVFSEFAQADASTTRRYGGTGLGLSITRRLCEMMGGRIDVDSRQGEGSTFTVTLPAAVCGDSPDETEAPEADASRCPVLVIDDDAEVRRLLRRQLRDSQYEVMEATGGEQGLQDASRRAPCAITLDALMPALGGWSVLESLYFDKSLASVPVYVLTLDGSRRRGVLLVTAPILAKPIRHFQLRTSIDRLTGVAAGGRVLVVDDDPASLQRIRAAMGEAWTVECTASVEDVVARCERDIPDVIILNLTMRNEHGADALEHATEILQGQVPTILVADRPLSEADRRRLDRCLEARLGRGGLQVDLLLQRLSGFVARAAECVPVEESS